MRHMSVDLETFSSVDIKKSGLYKYVQSPDFHILLFAYSFDDGPVQILDLAQGELLPPEIAFALQDPQVIKHAYNAPFEWYCLNKFYHSPLGQWRCTMLHGLYCGYTAGLAATAAALGLPEDKRKMSMGAALIRTFCVPCKPTASNGQRTRTLPHHEPEKWQLFKDYCRQDVVTEMEIERRLSLFPMPEQEQRLWELDQRMNAYGVAVDPELIDGALHCDEAITGELMNEAIRLSGLRNPKSVKQLSQWLSEETGEEVPDLTKSTVKELIKTVDSDTARRMLEIRQELAKTSVRKYTAMREAVCPDGRVRGLLQFYGANRTGRWAGRLVQVQNLPRNYLETLSHARECVKGKKLDALRVVYGNIPDTLSQLIRTAFIPSPGHVFLVADFSAIEARVIAWLAGEQWRLDVFATHGKIYEASASQMFGVPIELIKKGNPEYELRQKGKVAELACIAEGQLVLTNCGLVPIEQVTTAMRVWDGTEFVTHGGVLYRGIREVITHDGLSATADHLVWVEGQPGPVRFDESAARRARLFRPGFNRETLRTRGGNHPRKTVEARVEGALRVDAVYDLRRDSVDQLLQSGAWKIKRLPTLLPAPESTKMARPKANRSKAKMHKSERQKLFKLRSAGNRIPFQFYSGGRSLDTRKSGTPSEGLGAGQNRHQRPLRAGELTLYPETGQPSQQTVNGTTGMESRGMALCAKCSYPETVCRDDKRTNPSGSKADRKGQTEELARRRSKTRVYDILNCGPRNRYTVNGALVHNCGYQGSVGALKAMGADEMGLSDEELHSIIMRWRSANKRIVDLWYSLENAALEVMQTGQPVGIRGLLIAREGDYRNQQDFLTITLPSKRKLFYARPFLQVNDRGRQALYYHGVNQETKKWEIVPTYGGKLVENCVQGIARDCLAETLARLAAASYQVVMHVHDEVIIDVPVAESDLTKVTELMGQPIPWAPGLLLKADGFICDFYRKE